MFDVDVEDPFEQPGPAHAWRFSLGRGVIGWWLGGTLCRAGTIFLRNFALGASTPWKRIRCKRGRGTRAARRSMNSSGSMTIWVVPSLYGLFSLQHDLAGAITFEPFVGDGRPRDIAAELLEFQTLIGAPAQRRMEAKAVRVGTQLSGGRPGCARQALQAQHFLASAWAQRDTVGARGGLQRPQRALGIRFGEVGLVLR